MIFSLFCFIQKNFYCSDFYIESDYTFTFMRGNTIKEKWQEVTVSFSQEMAGSMVLFVFLCLTIPCFDAFPLKKRHSPLFQPNPFWDYQHFAEQNDFRQPGSIGVEITEPIVPPLNTVRSPL